MSVVRFTSSRIGSGMVHLLIHRTCIRPGIFPRNSSAIELSQTFTILLTLLKDGVRPTMARPLQRRLIGESYLGLFTFQQQVGQYVLQHPLGLPTRDVPLERGPVLGVSFPLGGNGSTKGCTKPHRKSRISVGHYNPDVGPPIRITTPVPLINEDRTFPINVGSQPYPIEFGRSQFPPIHLGLLVTHCPPPPALAGFGASTWYLPSLCAATAASTRC